MKYGQTFIYEDEYSNEDEELYNQNLQQPPVPPIPVVTPEDIQEEPVNYYEDEEEPQLPNKDVTLNQFNQPDAVSGIPPQAPFYEDEPDDLYTAYMNQPPQEPLAAPTYEDEPPQEQQFEPYQPESELPETPTPYEDENINPPQPTMSTPQGSGRLDDGLTGDEPEPPMSPEQPMQPESQPGQPPMNPTGVPAYEDEATGMNPNAPVDPNMDPNAPPMDPNAPPVDPNAPPMDPNAPPMDPNAMGGMPPEEDPSMMGDTGGFDADPYTSSWTDEKHPELRVGNSSEVTSGRPVSVEDISRINELKKINSQLMRIRGLLEKELKYKYNKVEDKLNEAIEYFRIIITNLDSYVNQVDDIIMKYKRFIMTILTQINVLKQQEINEN